MLRRARIVTFALAFPNSLPTTYSPASVADGQGLELNELCQDGGVVLLVCDSMEERGEGERKERMNSLSIPNVHASILRGLIV